MKYLKMFQMFHKNGQNYYTLFQHQNTYYNYIYINETVKQHLEDIKNQLNTLFHSIETFVKQFETN